MKRLITLLLVFCLWFGLTGCSATESPIIDSDATQTITDMAGRSLEIPKEIKTVYSTGPVGTVFLYTLCPEKLAGWNSPLREVEKRYIKPEYHNLPSLGVWRGSSTSGNIEELLRTKPDLLISMGDVSPEYIADADAIQEQLGIPLIMLDGSLKHVNASYDFMGKILGLEDRAAELGTYCTNAVDGVEDLVAAIPEDERVRVYYAEGPNGLDTEPKGSINAEAIEMAGAFNVADPGKIEVRRMQSSIEQIIMWEPEVIIVSSDGDEKHAIYNLILEDRAWSNIKAVKSGEVFEVPCVPYDWINRPPSVARILGIEWLANLLYPEMSTIDIRAETLRFFELFYDYDLTDQELDDIFKYAKRR
ncbi:MAG TPA: ABC transporter substrate-binding protein [Syntrophomonadaceae bacterium]|nr:ABC transporter substrate-binding protein [Syntrophomonadaceae bacterium]